VPFRLLVGGRESRVLQAQTGGADVVKGRFGRDAPESGPLRHATGALFEPLCFQNGLGGRRGKERDQRTCGVSLIAAGNDAGGELGVVLNR
jgi:hypothetical protein